eukprot:scaffold21349_cov157-Isochrysis_galbana.AAC.1
MVVYIICLLCEPGARLALVVAANVPGGRAGRRAQRAGRGRVGRRCRGVAQHYSCPRAVSSSPLDLFWGQVRAPTPRSHAAPGPRLARGGAAGSTRRVTGGHSLAAAESRFADCRRAHAIPVAAAAERGAPPSGARRRSPVCQSDGAGLRFAAHSSTVECSGGAAPGRRLRRQWRPVRWSAGRVQRRLGVHALGRHSAVCAVAGAAERTAAGGAAPEAPCVAAEPAPPTAAGAVEECGSVEASLNAPGVVVP